MQEKEIKEILARHRSGQATDDDVAFLESWYVQFKAPEAEHLSGAERFEAFENVWQNLRINANKNKTPKLWRYAAVAASITLILGFGLYFVAHKQPAPANKAYDLAPGTNQAVLTLSNGKKIILNSAQNGRLATQTNTEIKKRSNGELEYIPHSDQDVATSSELAYNTLTTPKGGVYHLVLPDKTDVWLDANSSITYPVAFNGTVRNVQVNGQAYFEVAHAKKQFQVNVKGLIIKDLGTHFNINAYDDEPVIKATLLEGSIRVSNAANAQLLLPGQQSIVYNNDPSAIKVATADIDEVMAWRKGLFHFEDADIKTAMRQLARWYNVEIVYEGELPKRAFSGDIKRDQNASVSLSILSLSGVHFQITDKKIIVKP